MAIRLFKSPIFCAGICASALGSAPMASLAQGLDSEGAIDTIVGSDVVSGELDAADEGERVIAAIEASMDHAQIVRRAFHIDGIDIVYLPRVGEGVSGIAAKIDEFADQIVELQQSIESSAIFYYAISSRRTLIRDIVAIEFLNEQKKATVFVVGAEPGNRYP